MKKVYWFQDQIQPLVYEYTPIQHDDLSSPYQLEPETFHCVCEQNETSLVISQGHSEKIWAIMTSQKKIDNRAKLQIVLTCTLQNSKIFLNFFFA